MGAEELNQNLKKARTFEDLKELIKISTECGCDLYMKRSGYLAYHFTETIKNRVHYLMDDGVSTGNSKVENLHRNMLFR